MEITAIIPTLNPTKRLLAVASQLRRAGFVHLIVVNDGSNPACQPIFDALAATDCKILVHPVNRGKGAALKTAFSAYLNDPLGDVGVVTLDDDGQHAIDDVLACCRAVEENPDALVLGVRNFDNPVVPGKSRFGNKITATVFGRFKGIHITDTQTGLRGIPNRLLPLFAVLEGEKFAYETNMLLSTGPNHVPIKEVPIATLYENNNKSTHFRTFADSWQIYRLFFHRKSRLLPLGHPVFPASGSQAGHCGRLR